MKSQIIVTQDFLSQIAALKEQNSGVNFYEFCGEEFLLDDAREISQKARLASVKECCYILAFDKYSQIAQNFMLKIIEEPPANVSFVLLAKSLNILLVTIKSRLICKVLDKAKSDYVLELDLRTFTLLDIANFSVEKHELQGFISSLLKACIEQKIPLNYELLSRFYQAMKLSCVHTNAKIISTNLLLGILGARR